MGGRLLLTIATVALLGACVPARYADPAEAPGHPANPAAAVAMPIELLDSFTYQRAEAAEEPAMSHDMSGVDDPGEMDSMSGMAADDHDVTTDHGAHQ